MLCSEDLVEHLISTEIKVQTGYVERATAERLLRSSINLRNQFQDRLEEAHPSVSTSVSMVSREPFSICPERPSDLDPVSQLHVR
jgi:hypothetical protein